MRHHVVATTAVVLLIGVMSAFLLLRRDPEYTYAVTGDGVMTVTGVARDTQQVTVRTAGAATGSVLRGQVYELTSGSTFDVPVTLAFHASDVNTVYHYDTAREMWDALETARTADGLLTVSATQGGQYAIGMQETVAAPDFVDEYATLRAMAPADAVGYTVAVAYAREGEPYMRLDTLGEQGGCGGAVLPGEREAESIREREANILVNDVQTTVTLRFLATWQLGAAACAQLSPFRSAAEHATLPVSE